MSESVCSLEEKNCKPCEGGVAPLAGDELDRLLGELNEWAQQDGQLVKLYTFTNYYQTIAFVNAIAWVSHRENHHPDLEVGFNQCRVRYVTHAIGGLSENDFICAAKVDRLSAA